MKTKQRVGVPKGMDREKAEAELARLVEEQARDLKISKVIQCRVRYFTDPSEKWQAKFGRCGI